MKLRLALALAFSGLSLPVLAAVSQQEAAELGKDLTPWGGDQSW